MMLDLNLHNEVKASEEIKNYEKSFIQYEIKRKRKQHMNRKFIIDYV